MVLASRGQRENENGSRSEIEDAELLGALRGRSRRVWIMVAVATAVTAALLLAAPAPLGAGG